MTIPIDFYPSKPLPKKYVERPVISGFTTLFTDLTHALTRPGLPPTVAELKRKFSMRIKPSFPSFHVLTTLRVCTWIED